MHKKFILLCLVCMTLLALSACQASQDTTLNTNHDELLRTMLTPEGAEVITDIEHFLVLNSTQTLSELVVFYEDAVNSLQLNEHEIDDSTEGIWIFSGVYHGIHYEVRGGGLTDGGDYSERPFVIILRDNDETVEIEIIY